MQMAKIAINIGKNVRGKGYPHVFTSKYVLKGTINYANRAAGQMPLLPKPSSAASYNIIFGIEL
jgi:hypothetical protein